MIITAPPTPRSLKDDTMTRYQSHQQNPQAESVRLILAYKNFAAVQGISHIGLGVTARNTAAVLRRLGYRVDVWPLAKDGSRDEGQVLMDRVAQTQADAIKKGEHPITHVVVSAPWLPTLVYQQLCMTHPEIVFAMSSHSNLPFLQYDGKGPQLLRESYRLAVGVSNFRAVGNCRRYTGFVSRTYGSPCWFLPNLYDLGNKTAHPHRRPMQNGPLRLGAFCATRQLKNLMSAVGAGLEVGNRLNRDVEIWISSGRDGTHAKPILQGMYALVDGLPWAKIVDNGWKSWPDFRTTIRSMDLLLQPTFSETFNVVTADGIAEGVASVVTSAIDWAPQSWWANPDDVQDIADKAIALLNDSFAPQTGLQYLQDYINSGVGEWKNYLLTPA